MQLVMTSAEEGLLLRDYLFKKQKLSTRTVKQLKYSEDGLLVNGSRVTVRYTLHAGDTLTLGLEETQMTEKIAPVDLPIDILYEDDDLIVPSKPANMPTHPSHDHYYDTVANALVYRYAQKNIPFLFRPVNRLDRDTSGLLLVARNRLSSCRLNESMRKGQIHKTYLAILEGHPAEDGGVIDTYMRRTDESIIVRRTCGADEGGEHAVTRFRVLARLPDGFSLVEASPLTGRTHQLRVHFAHIGHPIVGDGLYGHAHPDMPRQALHSHTLTFPHPTDGRILSLTSPLPTDMQHFLDLHGVETAPGT